MARLTAARTSGLYGDLHVAIRSEGEGTEEVRCTDDGVRRMGRPVCLVAPVAWGKPVLDSIGYPYVRPQRRRTITSLPVRNT